MKVLSPELQANSSVINRYVHNDSWNSPMKPWNGCSAWCCCCGFIFCCVTSVRNCLQTSSLQKEAKEKLPPKPSEMGGDDHSVPLIQETTNETHADPLPSPKLHQDHCKPSEAADTGAD